MPQTLVMMELELHKGGRAQGGGGSGGGGGGEGRVEPELTASELIHPPSAKRDRSSVIPFAERQGEEGRGGRGLSPRLSQWQRRKSKQHNNSGLLFWLWTQRHRVQSERHTDAV